MTRIIVKAMPSRQEHVDYLLARIPDLEVCWDQRRDAWDTYIRGLALAGAEASVQLEDDIVLTRNFRTKLEGVIAQRPDALIQFFSMRKADLTVGSRWERGGTFAMNQCTYYPAGMGPEIMAFAETWPRRAEHPTGYDLMLADFLKARRLKYWLHVPSLVDHRVARSLIDGRRSSKRQSLTFVDAWE